METQMVNWVVQLIVVLLICGFLYWIWTLVKPLLSFMPAILMQVIDILVTVLLVGVVLFYAIIPLIRMAPKLLGA